jgi:hypothetical protein
MKFETAYKKLKAGKRIRRQIWKPDVWLFLFRCSNCVDKKGRRVSKSTEVHFVFENLFFHFDDFIVLKTRDVCVPWSVTAEEVFTDDWEIVK